MPHPLRTTATVSLFSAAMVALAAGPVLAQSQPAREPAPQISVSATGTAELAPDMAVITLTVQREAETARAALDENTAAMTEVLEAMKAEGIAERDLQTANFNIQPVYSNPNAGNGRREEPRIVGYRVFNSLTVRIRDLSRLGSILDRSVTLGVNQGGGITFTNDDPSEAIEQARVQAMRNAIAKAETLTEAAGIGLGEILSISEHSGQPSPRPMARAAIMQMAADSAPVPVAAGENTYRVDVNVSFALDQ
ncbi:MULTISPECIES: SIMPL domain-containing protein [unclassified Roseitalea]|uniref:SIMPL domain-containing protein n=1 Tax=unclassified Roseitalea TaxID=2639107 RepID=UPI00273EFA56|nr:MULTISPECIES: SIMPL domain-containing protein [unclassified Roseitalea]